MATLPTDRPGAFATFRVLLVASLVSSLIMLDSNIVAVSLPAIARSLAATFAEIEWVVSAYILSFAALLMAAGSFADRHGRKRGMLIGLALFGAASGACGLANSSPMLNLARAAQGVGAALLLTASLAVIGHAFTGAARARAYAFWGSCLGIAITAGPIVGGVITDVVGWRWVFLVNVPLCAALFAATVRDVPESSDPEAKRLDVAGIVTFSLALFLLIWALIDGNATGWSSSAILLRLAGAAALFACFAVAELSQPRPMVDLGLFRRPAVVGAAAAMIGYAAAAQVMIFYLPLFLQNAYGFAPMAAGLAMLPFALPMFLAPRAGAALANRHSGRALLTAGLAVTLVGNVLFWALARAGAPYPALAAAMLVAGSGAGLLNSETTKAMMSAVPSQRAGMASGLGATLRFGGLLIGVAGFGAVLSHVAVGHFADAASRAGLSPTLASLAARRITSGDTVGVLAQMPEALREGIRTAGQAAFSDGFAAASLLAALVAAAAGLATFLLVDHGEAASTTAGEPAAAID
ncbi:MFS transporter [Chelatococcus reniformis]|uniref:MFS transporter n=1 Tax=Chelatococcus reniformis TaxID=1494448 RepID=A0A916U096_9HYPH|nr:MFS transporter [Chelatococcus reniformis]GGC52942.1 MFS transporter [Chelatococcus reniformis]